MRFLKDLLDQFVFHVIFVVSIGLTFAELSLIPQQLISDDWIVWALLIVWLTNVFALAWIWKRFGPTREGDEENPEDSADVFK